MKIILSLTMLCLTLAGSLIAQKPDAEPETSVKNYFPNPHSSRYFFAPSAIPLGKGEGYYQNAYFVSNSIQVAVSKNISVGGGVGIPYIYYLTPRIGFRAGDYLHLGAGMIAALPFSKNTGFGFWNLYGMVTAGSADNNVTLSAGMGKIKQEHYDAINQVEWHEWTYLKKPMFMLSGMCRLSEGFSLISENWFYYAKNEQTGYDEIHDEFEFKYAYDIVISAGGRIMGKKHSVDFGGMVISGDGEFLPLPYIDYVFKF
jgi:hypothetical protein